jgi:hypothetical protein
MTADELLLGNLDMAQTNVPFSRTYVHSQCGLETTVSGQAFEVVSNPMSSMEQTQCSICGKMDPITEFTWADTGETLSDYYARHTQNASDFQRLLCSKKFMVGLISLAAAFCAFGTYLLVANDNLSTRLICVAGGLMIGAFIGMAIFISGIANPITRKVCGVKDTRNLK